MEAMMTLVRFFPYWALPSAFVFFEIGVFAKRHRRKGLDIASFGIAGCLVVLVVLWIFARGDINSPRWVMGWFGYHS